MKKFTAEQFIATKWEPAEQKAKFANHFVKFVKSGYKYSLFHKWFYNRLSMCFGFIAHYNKNGFYDTYFADIEKIVRFWQVIENFPCYGDPEYTYSDVEKVLQGESTNY